MNSNTELEKFQSPISTKYCFFKRQANAQYFYFFAKNLIDIYHSYALNTLSGIRGLHCAKLIFIVFFTSINCLKVSSQVQIGSTINGQSAGDDFGETVSLSEDGNTLACGAFQFSVPPRGPGYVNVYRLNGTTWQQLGGSVYGINNGRIGSAVKISGDGNSFIVGAERHTSTLSRQGMVQVFRYNSGSWQQKGQTLFGDEADAWSGSSVAISSDGNIIAIGARRSSGGGVRRGQVKIFEWDGTQWVLKGFAINGPIDEAYMGTRLDMSSNGQVLVISGGIGISILAQVYAWNGNSWTQRGPDFTFPGQVYADATGGGVSVSNDGNVVAIKDALRIKVYEWTGSEWLQKGSSISGFGAGGIFGIDLTTGGDTLVFGQPSDNTVGTPNGGARILVFNGEQWVLSGNPVYGTQANDNLGSSVAINGSGSIFAVGAPGEFSGNDLMAIPGYARVYGIGPQISGVVTNPTCNNSNTGSVVTTVLGGAVPYTYLWSNGRTTKNLTNVVAGTYTVTVTCSNGFTGTKQFTLTNPPLLLASINCPLACFNQCNGQAIVTVSGGTPGYTYQWSGPNGYVAGNVSSITNLCPGTYRVTVTDSRGCKRIVSSNVFQNTQISINQIITPIACQNQSNGIITLAVSGGVAPYTYLWNNGTTNNNVANLCAGTYMVTVTDNKGCQETKAFTIVNPAPCSLAGGRIDDGFNLYDVNVYPNPTNNIVNININAVGQSQTNIRITDLLGRNLVDEAKELSDGDNVITYNLADYAAGVYLIYIGNDTEQRLFKVVKE